MGADLKNPHRLVGAAFCFVWVARKHVFSGALSPPAGGALMRDSSVCARFQNPRALRLLTASGVKLAGYQFHAILRDMMFFA